MYVDDRSSFAVDQDVMRPEIVACPADGLRRRGDNADPEVTKKPAWEIYRQLGTPEQVKVEALAALEATGGHRSQTAELLGISRKVLWEKIRDLAIEEPGEPEEG